MPSKLKLQPIDSLALPESLIPLLNERFRHFSAEAILLWVWETFGHYAVVSSSFQTQSVPLLHLISRICPEMPVLFIDTGFHFPETLTFRDELKARLGLNVVVARPLISKSQLFQKYGEGLYRRDPDLCCYINKVVPMQHAVAGMLAWISGVRMDQTARRQTLEVLELPSAGPLRVHPLLNWTEADIAAYRQEYALPAHPLYGKGYLSVGCAPCTRPVFVGEDARAGRWADSEKAECGLHLDWSKERKQDEQSGES